MVTSFPFPRPARFGVLVVAVLCGSLLAASAHASIAVSPMRVEVEPTPGGEVETFHLTVSNTCAETSRTVEFSVVDFWIAEDGSLQVGADAGAATASGYAGSRYVTVGRPSVTLGVREQAEIPFTVRLPSSATGSYGALITADAGLLTPSLQLGAPFDVRVRYSVSVFVLITAHATYSGGMRAPATPGRQGLSVSDVHTALPAPGDAGQTARVFALVTNSGSAPVSGRILGVVTDAEDGTIVERVTLEGGTRLLLPGSQRRFYGDIRSPLPPGTYRTTVQVVADDGSARASASGQLNLREGVVGALPAIPRPHVLSVDRVSVLMTANGSRSDRKDIEVRNHLREAVTVEARSPSGEGSWLNVTPRQFTLPPLGARSLRVRAESDDRIAPGKHVHEIVLTPRPRGSDAPLEAEAIRLQVVVLSPRTDD